jgi:uncharacterized RDD family membrane protein YckC
LVHDWHKLGNIKPLPPLPCRLPVAFSKKPGRSPTNPDKNQIEYASFGIRVAALILDGLILCSAILIPNVLLRIPIESIPNNKLFTLCNTILDLSIYIQAMLYSPFFESGSWQGTPGKKILGLKVQHINGTQISFWRAGLRTLGMESSSIGMLGYLLVLFTKKNQCLHDLIAKTVVVKDR